MLTFPADKMVNSLKRRSLLLAAAFILVWMLPLPAVAADSLSVLYVEQLPTGEQVKASGKLLISQPAGFTRIHHDSSYDMRTVILGVHGWKSEGYEWVAPITKLSEHYRHTYFYRYKWETCPDSAAAELATAVTQLIGKAPGVNSVVLFGHSYGGLLVTFLASKLHLNIPMEIHTIASPLKGYANLYKRCELDKQRDGVLRFPAWEANVSHFQWRTQHRLDGAFRRMKQDPQAVDLDGSDVTLLPQSMNGRRLGHNWSITWVIDEYLRIPHVP